MRNTLVLPLPRWTALWLWTGPFHLPSLICSRRNCHNHNQSYCEGRRRSRAQVPNSGAEEHTHISPCYVPCWIKHLLCSQVSEEVQWVNWGQDISSELPHLQRGDWTGWCLATPSDWMFSHLKWWQPQHCTAYKQASLRYLFGCCSHGYTAYVNSHLNDCNVQQMGTISKSLCYWHWTKSMTTTRFVQF